MKTMKSIVLIGLSIIPGTAHAVPEISPIFSRYAVDEGSVNLLVHEKSSTGLSKGFTTTLRYGDTELTERHDFEVSSYLNYAQIIRLKDKINGKAGERVPYTVTITDTDGSSFVCTGEMRFIDELQASRGILVEEATGTWCGNCVRGIVGMSLLEEKYGNRFIGVAVHYKDPMQCEYFDHLSQAGYAGAFPTVTINRTASPLDPYYGAAAAGMWSNISAFEAALEEPPIVSLEVSAEYSQLMRKAWLTCRSKWAWAEPEHEYGYMFAVIENDVHVRAGGYNQQNTMAGQTHGGVWEWIENAGSPIPSDKMWYQEVARSVEHFNGIAPDHSPVPGEEDVFEYELTFPDNVIEGKNQILVVALLDKTSGEVVNAAKIPFADITTGARMPLFYCGGNWGYLTPGIEVYDLDDLEPFAGIPVERGDGWSVVRLENVNTSESAEYVMASTSYYRQSGQSDDWMVTPAIELPADGHNTLSWRSRASLADASDGYEVYVAENAVTPDEIRCNGDKVFSTVSESPDWTNHEINLDKYSGKTVRVAFRNNSTNCEMLYVDDLTIDNDLRQSGTGAIQINAEASSPLSLEYMDGTVRAQDTDDSSIRIEIYSLQGTRLAVNSGRGSVSLDLRASGCAGSSEGVFIVRAQTPTQITYRKIIITRH